jgi:hypothetical protein
VMKMGKIAMTIMFLLLAALIVDSAQSLFF